eukprot:gene3254-13277_t
MPQKPLKVAKSKGKKLAANKHGKSAAITKKGKKEIQPNKGRILEEYKDNKDITKMINKRNEGAAAASANKAGGLVKTVGAPPALAPKDAIKRAKAAAAEKRDGGGAEAEAEAMDASDDDE